MHNLNSDEIAELMAMGIDPSTVVSAYHTAAPGMGVNTGLTPQVMNQLNAQPQETMLGKIQSGINNGLNTAGNLFNNQSAPAPLLPTVSGYDPTPNMYAPFATQNDESNYLYSKEADKAKALQDARDASNVSVKDKIVNKLKDKYADKLVDKDGKPINYKPFQKSMQGLMGGISYATGLQQAADTQQQNRMANQTIFNKPGNTKEYYNNDFVGENDPMFFLNSRNGSKAEGGPMYAPNGVPIEAEGGEFYLDPSTGATLPIHGPSHEQGGVKMVAESGSYIMSDHVKIPAQYINDIAKKNLVKNGKALTISDAIRQFPQYFDTKADAEKLNDRTIDTISRNSYEMNMKKKLANVAKLLAYQQQMNGGHGEENGPEAKYGMQINGGAMSFDYRPDELRVKDMMGMGQMPTAAGGTKNITPKFKTKEEAEAFYKAHAPSTPQQKEAFHKELEAAIKRGDKKFVFSGNGVAYEAKEDPNYNTGRLTGVNNTVLELNGKPATPEQYNTYYGVNPTSEELLISPRGFGAIGSFENTLGRADLTTGKPIGMGQKEDYAYTGGTTNPQIYKQINDFVKNTIGRDTWNKMPDELKTQMYSFAFNHGIDTPEKQQHVLSGLAQAVEHSKPGSTTPSGLAYRQGLSSADALKIIKGANLSDQNVLNKYIDVLGDQYGTLAQSQPEAYRSTMAGRAATIHQLYNQGKAATQPQKLGNEYIYPAEGVQSTIKSIQNTGKAGYDLVNMEDANFKNDFKARHPDIWQKYNMDKWKAEDYHNKDKVMSVQKDLNAKGFHIKEDGLWGSQTFQVPGVKTNTPTVDKMTLPITPETPPETPPTTPPKQNPPYKEHLPLGQYMGLLPSPRTQNYLPQYRQNIYEPNLVSLRSAKNDQVAAMNSMLQNEGMNPATASARAASMYGEAAKNIGAITEQENNTNAQILNQAKAANSQMDNQMQGLQQQANHQYVTENVQDLAALDADRYKKLSDLYTAQQKVNQYNKTLGFIDNTMGKNMDITVDNEGNVGITRNNAKVDFDPTTMNAEQVAQLRKMMSTTAATQNTDAAAPGNNATNTKTNRIGGAVKKRSKLII